MEIYKTFLENNEDTLNFIKNNDIGEEIYKANLEAEELGCIEGKNYLHSYRFSKVFDVLKANNLSRENISNILTLLENPFNKKIDEMLEDFTAINMEFDDEQTL